MHKRMVIVFEAGDLQVYTFQTEEEIGKNAPHREMYWNSKSAMMAYGPFPTLYDAMNHYRTVVESQKATDGKRQVVYVNFKNRTRINYK